MRQPNRWTRVVLRPLALLLVAAALFANAAFAEMKTLTLAVSGMT